MKTTTHPVLDLVINENGSQIWYNGKLLKVHSYQLKGRNYTTRLVRFGSNTVTVAKLVCEAWNGMREEMNQTVQRKDKNPDNDHYTNLYWARRGNTRTGRTSRCKTSSFKESDVPAIIRRLEAGEKTSKIANSYNASRRSVRRIKNLYMLDAAFKLKHTVRTAKTPYQQKQAYAKYLGYDNVAEVIAAIGAYQFKKQIEQLSKTI